MKPDESMNRADAWRPILLDELQFEVRKGIARMDEELSRLWDAIQSPLAKWHRVPCGAERGVEHFCDQDDLDALVRSLAQTGRQIE